MDDKRNWKEPSKDRKNALKVLEKAKQNDAQKRANGAHFYKVSDKTYKLIENANSSN